MPDPLAGEAPMQDGQYHSPTTTDRDRWQMMFDCENASDYRETRTNG